MKKRMNKMILLGGLSLLVLAGCQKGLFDSKGGRAVAFSANSGATTKTAYDGGDPINNMQRIDWQDGDEVVIFGDKAVNDQGQTYATYTIVGESIQAVGATSKAKLTGSDETVLRYKDEDKDPYAFVGVYPSSGTSFAENKVTVNSIIPSEQTLLANGFPDMKYGTQLLSDPVKADWYSAVSLNFKPNFTSFEFSLAAEKSMKLTGFYVSSSKSVMHGGYKSEIDLGAASPAWSTTVENGDTRKFIQVTFPAPLEMTLPEGETLTNTVKFGFYTLPADMEELTFKFYLQFEEGGETINATRTLVARYAKDGDGYSQGDMVKFAGGKKHDITGIVIPANLSQEIVLDLAVIPWDDASGTITYGPDAVVNALALEYASGAAITSGSGRRTNNNFANATDPIHAYFSVYSPVGNGAQWKIKVTGATEKLLVSADNATSTTTDDGLELTGTTGGRVHFTIDRATGDNAPTASDQIQLNFFVVLNGREINMNSEITRGGALTITGKVGR